MRVMVLVKASAESEAGALPSEQALTRMSRYNEELVEAGILIDGDGLRPSANGVRVRVDGDTTSVTDGPFAETKELVSGYWIWRVESMEEAVAWLKRAPFDGNEVEIRPISEVEDFGEAMTPELRAREDRIQEKQSSNRAVAASRSSTAAPPPSR